MSAFDKNKIEQECIPVGCVPDAHQPYAGGGGSLPLVLGVSALVACGVSALVPGGFALVPGGIYPSMQWVDPPVNRITDTSKTITLARTSLRPVMNSSNIVKFTQIEIH